MPLRRSSIDQASPQVAGEPVLLVVGMHRSGTSAVAGLLASMGVPTTAARDLMPPKPENPKGFFESESLRQFNDRLLRKLGGSWSTPPPLPSGWPADLPAKLRRRGLETFERVSPATGPVMWKDPRNSLLLPFWRQTLHRRLIVLLVHRRPEDVARSLWSRSAINGSRALALWARYTVDALSGADGLPLYVTSFERALNAPLDWCEAVGAFLADQGVTASGPAGGADGFLDPSLAHRAAEAVDRHEPVDSLASALARLEGPHPAWQSRSVLGQLPDPTQMVSE